jgi:hypothetical protein
MLTDPDERDSEDPLPITTSPLRTDEVAVVRMDTSD